MTGLGIAVAFLLLLWLSLLYVPFRWRPAGIFLIMEKALAVAYVPFIAAIGAALAVVGAVFGSWWIAIPAGVAAVGALAVMVRVGSARADLSGALGAVWRRGDLPARQRLLHPRQGLWDAAAVPAPGRAGACGHGCGLPAVPGDRRPGDGCGRQARRRLGARTRGLSPGRPRPDRARRGFIRRPPVAADRVRLRRPRADATRARRVRPAGVRGCIAVR